jgi:hypothetical protein
MYDGSHQMADGGDDVRMTAAEEVLAFLLIERVGVPDDVGYTPDQAQEIIGARLSGKKPTIAVGTYTICELYAGRVVDSDHAFMEPADDLVQLNNQDRPPSKYDVLLALEVIQQANGADLDEWTKGVLPSDDIREALAAIKSSRENDNAR